MKYCSYCGHRIAGEAKEIMPEAESGARPSAYWHKLPEDCRAADREHGNESSPLQRRLSSL